MTAALTGVVLAGGGSRRMGRDKATLLVGGTRLVDRAVAVLRQCCDDVLLAAGGRPLSVAGARTISDTEPGAGPLSGIVAALRVARTPLVAVVAVDMPHASAGVLRALAEQWTGEAAVAPRVAGRVHPLHAVYAVDAADRFAAVLIGGERSAQRALQQLGARIVGPEVWGEIDPAGAFAANVNAPQDLADLPADPPR